MEFWARHQAPTFCVLLFFSYTIINFKKKSRRLWPIAASTISRSYCQIALYRALTETLTGTCVPSSVRETDVKHRVLTNHGERIERRLPPGTNLAQNLF